LIFKEHGQAGQINESAGKMDSSEKKRKI